MTAPAASAVRCRWCGASTHSIEHCPAVVRAFGPDPVERACYICGALVTPTARSRRVLCADCRRQTRLEYEARVRSMRKTPLLEDGEFIVLYAPRASGYERGMRLRYFAEAVQAGYAEPGMLVRRNIVERNGKTRSQYFAVLGDVTRQRLVQVATPSAFFKRHVAASQ